MPRAGLQSLILLAATLTAPIARAESATSPSGAPPEAAIGDLPAPFRVGLDATFLPVGRASLRVSDSGRTGHSTAFAYGVRAKVDRVWTRGFVGFASQLTLNARESHAGGTEPAGTMFDFLARLGLHFPIGEIVRLQAFLTPGYSIVRRPPRPLARGATVGINVGLVTDVGESGYWNIEAGYQQGFTSSELWGEDYAYELGYLQLALGVGFRF
jgi:hypothetical protein